MQKLYNLENVHLVTTMNMYAMHECCKLFYDSFQIII